jgi:dienelactone hydrolase
VRWVSVSAPDLGTMLAAIATPARRPPFPSVLLLHGTHGFAREYVELAVELSPGGVVGGCGVLVFRRRRRGARASLRPLRVPMRRHSHRPELTALAGLSTFWYRLFAICRMRARIMRRCSAIHVAAVPR